MCTCYIMDDLCFLSRLNEFMMNPKWVEPWLQVLAPASIASMDKGLKH